MMPTGEKSFRTIAGTCRITPEQIIMTRDGVNGAMGRYLIEVFPGGAAGLYMICGILLVTLAIVAGYRTTGDAVPLGFVGGALVLLGLRRRGRKGLAVIQRSSVRAVRTRDPDFLNPQAIMTIYFEARGRMRSYAVQLPQAGDRGLDEYEWAKTIMHEQGLLGSPSSEASRR